MDTDFKAKNRKRVILGIVAVWVVIVLVAIVYAMVINMTRSGKYELTVKCAPYTAAVFVDDARVENNAKVYLESGKHDVMCFEAGLEIYTEEMDLEEGDNILIGLAPVTEDGRKEVEKKTKDYYDLEAFSGKASQQEIGVKYTEEEKRIAKILPITHDGYGIGVLKDGESFWVTITEKKYGYINVAVNRLLAEMREAGIPIVEYNVKINDFENMFEKYQLDGGVSATEIEDYLKKVYNGLDMEMRGTDTVDGYGYALITVRQPSGERVTYRAVFKDAGGTWRLAGTPEPILTVNNTLDIPKEVLEKVNNKEPVRAGNT